MTGYCAGSDRSSSRSWGKHTVCRLPRIIVISGRRIWASRKIFVHLTELMWPHREPRDMSRWLTGSKINTFNRESNMDQSQLSLIKQQIIEAGQLLWEKGLVTGFNGNISRRVDHETIVITGAG